MREREERERERERARARRHEGGITSHHLIISYFLTHSDTFTLSHTLPHTLSRTLSLVSSHKPSPADVCPRTLARLLIMGS